MGLYCCFLLGNAMRQDVILVDENDQIIGKSEKLAALIVFQSKECNVTK